MSFDPSHVWLLIAVLLVLASALSADFTLIALATAAAVGSAVAGFTDAGWKVQVAAVAVTAGVLGPVLHFLVRPLLRGPRYGTTGTGEEQGTQTKVVVSNGRHGIRLQHDFFPVQTETGEIPAEGDLVTVQRFDGITAVVEVEPPADSNQPGSS